MAAGEVDRTRFPAIDRGTLQVDAIAALLRRPALFAPGTSHFWTDPHISRQMLAAHLDPTTDAASRRPATIDAEAGEVTYYDRENLAFAVDTEKGLITPVIRDAGDLSVAGLAKKIADVAERTRTNKIGPDELSGGTFTITNLGSFGALWDTPIINKPQVAILGPGAVVKRPVVIDDPDLGETIAVRHMVYLALTYDHRLVDGADAGRFLADVKKRLEAGQFEV